LSSLKAFTPSDSAQRINPTVIPFGKREKRKRNKEERKRMKNKKEEKREREKRNQDETSTPAKELLKRN